MTQSDRDRLLAHYRIEQRELQRILSDKISELAKINAKLTQIERQIQKYETER